jgi:hypothetical protein
MALVSSFEWPTIGRKDTNCQFYAKNLLNKAQQLKNASDNKTTAPNKKKNLVRAIPSSIAL